MPLDDLDLEFEDDDESKKKKSEAVQVDVDLEFAAPEGARPRPSQPSRPGGPGAPAAPARPGEVRRLDEARAEQQPLQVRRPMPVQQTPPQSAPPRTAGTSALKEEPAYDVESQHVNGLREQMKRVELDAQVKVAVAEFKTDYLSEMLSDMKLAEHQIGQLLARINAKHPDMKNEVLMIKKVLADFVSKKRK